MELEADRLTMPDVSALKVAYTEQQSRLPVVTKCSFKPALRAPVLDKHPFVPVTIIGFIQCYVVLLLIHTVSANLHTGKLKDVIVLNLKTHC